MLKTSSNKCTPNQNEPKEVPGDKKRNSFADDKSNVEVDKMGHKGYYTKVLSKNNVTQSLPNCVVNKNKSEEIDTVDVCDIHKELLDSPPQSPWFKTWPERDKFKALNLQNTQDKCDSKHNLENGNVKNKVSLNEALQSISLAYSPVTKQLHLVEKVATREVNEFDENTNIKKGHKRNPSSFSSTVSSISEPSPSKSLLDGDQKSLEDSDNYHGRKKSLTNFLVRNVFMSWKSSSSYSSGSSTSSSVWKLFTKNSKGNCSSPHRLASSTALIQHPRPSNLPAKTQKEEERHREEYKAIIAAAKKKETQNNVARQKQQKLQLQQEEHQAAAAKHFIRHVLPNWERMRTTKKTGDLWWQGLPSCVRGRVWRLAIGNDLNLTPQLYEICLSRAQNRLSSPAPSHSDLDDLDKESSMDVIQLDISRTFPHLCIFQQGGPYSDILHSLLAAYVCYRPDVGYVQGMSYIAAILILNMEAYDAFICFANLLNQPLHLSAFTLNQQQMEAYYRAYNEVFMYNLPRLHHHFEEAKLTPDLYLLDWIYTVFAKAMPLDVACRVWDIFLRDGCEFIFRTALGILHLNQDTLLKMDFLHGAQFLTRLPDDLSSDQLFKSIQAVTTTIGKQNFCQIVDKHSSCR